MQFLDVDSRLPGAAALEIVLKTVPSELQDVTVEGLEQGKLHEYYQRKQQRGSFARFLEQREIQRLGPMYASDLFRTVPGIDIRTRRGAIQSASAAAHDGLARRTAFTGAEPMKSLSPRGDCAIEFYPRMPNTRAVSERQTVSAVWLLLDQNA